MYQIISAYLRTLITDNNKTTKTIMKKQLLTLAAISTVALASCGGSNEEEIQNELNLLESEVNDMIEDDSEEDDSSIDMEEVESTDETSSSDEWSKVLDDYESYVDDYTALIKKQKADPTDMSIMTEYQQLMQKGTEWSTKMSEISSEFGPKELTRMQEIQTKLSKAAM